MARLLQALQLALVVLLAHLLAAQALNNGLGRTPQMGWNSWDFFFCNINETIIRSAAHALVNSGLKAAGYNHVLIDDCWAKGRFPNGTVYADPVTFPSGMAALANYVHGLGLKIGLYSDAGNYTCQGRPGSLGYEKIDAATYAAWGYDYLKYDNCNNDNIPPQTRYPIMRDALNATGRPIFYSLCEWGQDNPATWAVPVGNSWRTTGDITFTWSSIMGNLNQNNQWASYAAPGGWNDPDMLEVGNGALTQDQEVAHFSLWALIKAPLIIGTDISNITANTLAIYTNGEAIAVNQDPLGAQGKLLLGTGPSNQLQVWGGPLADGSVACILFNLSPTAQSITASWSTLKLPTNAPAQVRDLWQHKNLGNFTGSFSNKIDANGGSQMLRITPVHSADRDALLRAWGF